MVHLIKYIIKRLIVTIPVMLGVLIIVFTISYLTPGDPVTTILGSAWTPEKYAEKSKELGLDKGYLGQLGSYIWNLVTKFSMGKSYATNIPVMQELASRIPVTFKIAFLCVCMMVLIGIPLGILSATRQYSALDMSLTSLALILAAVPAFVLALLCLILFGVKLKWFPISGVSTWKSWVLPVATDALGGVAVVMRMTRTTMLEVVRQDYIRTARSKGLKENAIIRRHALKNCMIPVVTVVGSWLAVLMCGALIIETIFSIPGVGMYLMGGISARDYPIINGAVVFISFIMCAMNLIVDILYALIDPRIKTQYISNKRTPVTKKLIAESAEVAES